MVSSTLPECHEYLEPYKSMSGETVFCVSIFAS